MVALAILGVSIVSIFQLFSITLRSTKKAENYTRALINARSLMDGLYLKPDPRDDAGSVDLGDGFSANKEVSLKSSSDDETVKLYEMIVTVTWPPSGSLKIKGLRTVREPE
jgi:Tfp pilus assembly protein PilV